jgi:hypothetical protein
LKQLHGRQCNRKDHGEEAHGGRAIPIDVMVYAVVAMNSVNADVPFVSLLGDMFEADPGGIARMLGDILLDGLVIDRTA